MARPSSLPDIMEFPRSAVTQVSLLPGAAARLDADIAECERAIQRLQGELDRLRRARGLLGGPTAEGVDAPSPTAPAATPGGKRRTARASAAGTIRTFAREALIAAARPLDRGEILDAMRHAGVTIDVKDPGKRVNKALWKADGFVHTQRGYWLADTPIPASGV